MKGFIAVEVALPRPVWRTYTYLLPSWMADGTLEGCRVEVPFGREILTGWIWSRTTTSPSSIQLKEVAARLDSSPAIPRPVLRMVRWAADYYAAPPGMMIASAFPAGIHRSMKLVVSHCGGDRALLDGHLEPGAVVDADELAKGFQSRSALMSQIGGLENCGTVRTWLEPRSGRRRNDAISVIPARTPGELMEAAGRLRRKAPSQAAILERLSRSDGPVTRSILLKETGASPDSLAAVIRSGAATEAESAPGGIPGNGRGLAGRAVENLEPAQEAVLAEIAAKKGGEGVFLLHGITGSGKTEIYLRVIARTIESGRQALVLVPEISLTPQLVSRFERRFPGLIAVMHSALSPTERMRSWSRLSRGIARIAIGPRSAVFAPLPDPGTIIVDEEHDTSYKQQEQPRYNARDLAVIRGSMERIPVLLGSATPSLESWGNAASGKYVLLSLPRRAGGKPLPSVRATRVSSPDGDGLVPPEVMHGLGERMRKGEQAIVLVNRRGFAPSRICFVCGHRETCPECGISPTFHSRGSVLRCHHCGWWINAPAHCPECGSGRFVTEGPGVQKVEEYLSRSIPGLRIMRLDRDTVSAPGVDWEILRRFADGEADVLLGTQMVAKGHDFPGVTLVGILAADLALSFPDFRASERAFQLVLQASGRAGRGDLPGEVLVQTLQPGAFAAAISQDYAAFLEEELPARRLLGYPPYGHVVRFLWTGPDEKRVREAACRSLAGGSPLPGVRSFPPAPAIFPRLRGRWRYSSLARSSSRAALRKLVRKVLEGFESAPTPGVLLDVDVDPLDLL